MKAILLVFGACASLAAAVAMSNPYAGQERRAIKALSAEEVDSYLAGKGAGLAKAAELNHYPGPAHVLELADALKLTPEQKARTQSIFDAMQREAKRNGAALIAAERELDRQFADGVATPDSLRAVLARIGALQAEVRRAHLAAHIAQRALLTPAQIEKYDVLRGYTGESGGDARQHRH